MRHAYAPAPSGSRAPPAPFVCHALCLGASGPAPPCVAEYDAQVDGIRNEVQAAHARLERSLETVRLYVDTILPASQANVEAASAGYEAGNLDFLRLVEAERQFIELQEKHQEAVAEYHRNRAELDRVVGAGL
ncbi:MAG: TolC family protein [Deltaproteobacteria bacterium]